MRIILKEDVVGVGDIGETVSVKPGFARNFLIPRGFAIEAESSSARQIAHKMRQIIAKKKRFKSSAEEEASKMKDISLPLTLRVGTGGKVFGSINNKAISEKLSELGYNIDRRRILLSEPIKKAGTYFVEVKLHPEVKVRMRIDVEAVSASKEEEALEAELARVAIEKNKAEAEEGLLKEEVNSNANESKK
jgi:large subunit ribosomal protein L9